MIRTERKYIEILRILKEHDEPVGAKRLSEIMAERGYVLTDRAVQYYLQYLDEMGFTEKVGNMGRILTDAGISETDCALVGDRIGFIISKLERLAYRTTFNPETGTGDVAYNLSMVPKDQEEQLCGVFDEIIKAECGFFSKYKLLDHDPRIPPDSIGIMTICSISMDGVFQRNGIPVRMAYGGRLMIENGIPGDFLDLIGYRGTTIDPLQLFISAGLTSVRTLVRTKSGIGLANVREVPSPAENRVKELITAMKKCGFMFPVSMGHKVLNLQPNPNRISIVSYSGMNYIANAVEQGLKITTEIGAGNVRFSKINE